MRPVQLLNQILSSTKQQVGSLIFPHGRLYVVWLLVLAMSLQSTAAPFGNAEHLSPLSSPTPRIAKNTLTTNPAAPIQGSDPLITFGPKRFDRLPGPPRSAIEIFPLPQGLATSYTLRIQNGATDGTKRVTSAIVLLNSAPIALGATLNRSVPSLEQVVTLAPSNSLSVRIVGAPDSYLTITILARPAITSINPARGRAGDAVTITGDYFDATSPNLNTVRFAKAGGGQTSALITTVTRTQITAIVPSDAATGPISVQTSAGSTNSTSNFEFIAAFPVLADFNPKKGPTGTVVTITGTDLKSGTDTPAVTFAGSNGVRLPALVTSSSSTEVKATVPNGAITGPIELTNAFGKASTSTAFTVESPLDFTLTALPATKTSPQGSTVVYVVNLTSEQPNFTQLVELSVTGVPTGATASFNPAQITVGASATLSVVLSGTVSPVTHNLTISGKATVEGRLLTKTVPVTLSVQAAGQTTLAGRVLSTKNEPVLGATVSLDGKTGTTDASGSFLLSGITEGRDRPVMVDGRTASAPNRTYPVIVEPATVVAGQANVVPFTFYLPPIDIQHEVTIVPTQTNVVTTPMVPNLQMTVPAGANLRARDGSAVTQVSLTPVEIDRTPAPLPSNVGAAMVFSAQPGGAVANMPLPVVYPNPTGANPGTRMELYNFDHDNARWYVYGYGRVSADGRTIVPENDPATGKSYGLPYFSWHFPNASATGNPRDAAGCPSPETKTPVDLSTGVKLETMTDIAFGGARGGLDLTRVYTSDLANSCDSCPFGRGTTHNYAIRLVGGFQTGGSGRLITPEQVSGWLFSYLRTESDGTLVFNNTTMIGSLGGIIRKLTNGTYEYRSRQGDVMRFDSSGKLAALVDRNTNTTSLTYTGANLTRITDPVGRSITLEYDGSNRIVKATDPLLREWRYTYEGTPGVAGAPGLTTVTDPLSNVMRYTYVAGGRLASVIDKRGNVMKEIKYDGSGRVIEQRMADNGVEKYEYTLSGQFVTSATVTDSLNRVRKQRFNALGYVTETTDAFGQNAEIERDMGNNLPKQTKGPCGCTEAARKFDEHGNVIEVADRIGNVTKIEYEPTFNNPTKITDKLGRMTRLGYDARGNLTAITDALNQVTQLTYDQFGQLIQISDPLSHKRSFEYDDKGNVKAVLDALNNRTTFTYDVVGRLLTSADPLGRTSTFEYDALNRLLATTDPANATTRFTYDPNGNRLSVTDALNRKWSSEYNTKNRLISQTDPLNRVTRWDYNTADEMVAVISPLGRATRYSYDQRGQMATITDPMGGVIRFVYDNVGNLLSLTDQRSNVTTFTYDQLYRMNSMRDPLGQFTNYIYDATGNLIEKTDRLKRRTAYTYDNLNRAVRIDYADAFVTNIYDAAGRMTQVTDSQAAGPITWTYDDANRVLSEMSPAGTISYTYNNASQRATMTAADRAAVTYGYDAAGRLQKITQGAEVFTYSYDALSRRIGLQRPNGVTTTYSYDEVSRLTRLLHTSSNGTPIEDFGYSYDTDDRITGISSLASASLLPQSKTVNAADANNRITQFGGASYGFDDVGQTISKTTAQGTTNYQWDARGRLNSVRLLGNKTVNYGYDALGRLSSRGADGVTTNFLYDADDIVLDKASNGSAVDYLNGAGIDEKLRLQASSLGNQYFLTDHLGSTIAIAGTSGIAEKRSYEAFGETPNGSATRYGFTGREKDELTGLMYYRARWHDPQQGRFILEDPIGFKSDETNFYVYGSNDPILSADPNGMQVFDVLKNFLKGFAKNPLSLKTPVKAVIEVSTNGVEALGKTVHVSPYGAVSGILVKLPELAVEYTKATYAVRNYVNQVAPTYSDLIRSCDISEDEAVDYIVGSNYIPPSFDFFFNPKQARENLKQKIRNSGQ